MNSTSKWLSLLYKRTHRHYGPLHWWPGETPFEVMVGAILTQNTAWGNVEKAIANLKKEKVLEPHKLYHLKPSKLAQLIRPAGYFRVKTKRLRNFLKFLLDECDGDIARLKQQPLETLRQKLLAVNGVGPETADSILLYALEKPIFVIDAYTKRILSRHYFLTSREAALRGRLHPRGAGWRGRREPLKIGTTYEELQHLFMSRLKPNVAFYNEYHAQLVNIGKDFCRTKPRCEACPLNGLNW